MMTPEKLKGKIRNVAKEKGLSSQEILQMYLFERVIDRLSKSRYKSNFILKGGFLIASMVGVEERTTMDIDTTISGLSMDEDEIVRTVKEIFAIDAGDGIEFVYERIEPIMENAEYASFRVHFFAKYGKINNPMKMDITTNDIIIPAAIQYKYNTVFDEGTIDVKSYNLESTLAEKYETIIRRNIGNTRARDFYDLHMLYKLYRGKINDKIFAMTLEMLGKKRGSSEELAQWQEICSEIREEGVLRKLWSDYQKEYKYAEGVSFDSIMDVVEEIGERYLGVNIGGKAMKSSNKIFISYSHKDKALVEAVVKKLELEFGRNNIFYDAWSIVPGDSIIGKMSEGLEDFTTFFFFLSQNSLESKMATLEWRTALNKSVKNDLRFVAVRIEDCRIPAILSDIQYIDMYGERIETAIEKMKLVSGFGVKDKSLGDIKNLVASAKRMGSDVVQIEVEARHFMEENPEIAFACKNDIDYSSICFDVEYGMYHFRDEQVIDDKGVHLNAKIVSLQRAIKPGFPYIFQVYFDKTDKFEDVVLLQLIDRVEGEFQEIPLYDESGMLIRTLEK